MLFDHSKRSKDINKVIKRLENVYENPDSEAKKWRERGGKVAGYLGSDVPEELLIAGGFLPVRISGNQKAGEKNKAEQYLERGFDPLIHAQFNRIINQSYWYLDRLVISNTSDAIIRVFYYLRALHQVEPELKLPSIYFFDFLHTHFRMSALYNRERLKELLAEIEKWTGHAINHDVICEAINTCNENRKLLREIQHLRGKNIKISGVEALKIIGSSMLMSKSEHNNLLSSLLSNKESLPALSEPRARLFVSGSTHDHTGFYELVESSGAVIVGEDHEVSARAFTKDVSINADPIDGIVDRYHLRNPSSHQATVSDRIESLVGNVTDSNSDGVIFFIHQADDAPSWDFPEQNKALRRLGIPTLLIDRQPYALWDESERNNVFERVSRFVSEIRK